MRRCSASKTGLSCDCSPKRRADPPLFRSSLLCPLLRNRAAAAGSLARTAVAIDIGIVAWAAVETWATWP